MTVGEKIRYFRTIQKLSQKELAQMSGMSEPALRNYELGNRKPSEKNLKRIAEALGVNVYAISAPCLDTSAGVMQILFELEDNYGLTVKNIDGEICLVLQREKSSKELGEGMRLWNIEMNKLKNNEITHEEYDMWRHSFMKDAVIQSE